MSRQQRRRQWSGQRRQFSPRWLLWGVGGLVSAVVLVGILAASGVFSRADQGGGGTVRPYTFTDTSADASAMFPRYVTADVRDGYQFALAHPDVLQYLPCYCGCGLTAGHTSNLDCFIAGVEGDGTVRFDDHGSFCDICLQIARDAKRLLGEGKTLSQIRAYVDQAHGEKGPGTDTPLPPG